MTRRFAEDTSVPVSRSQDAAKALLRGMKADAIAVYEDTAKHALAFTLGGRQYRISVPIPQKAKNPEQEARRTWRLLLLLVKSKLEAVREGATTVEREFLADMVMPDGSTVGEWANHQMAIAYSSGAMPPLMIAGPR